MSARTTRPNPARPAALLLPALLLAGCQSEWFGGGDTHSPAVQQTDYAQQKIDAGPRKTKDLWGADQRDPSQEPVMALCHDMRGQPAGMGNGVACFPLVSLDLRDHPPYVSELGVKVADAIARELGTTSAGSKVLASNDLAVQLASANLSRSSLTTIEAAAGAAKRLGVDRVTFGTIKRHDKVGALERDVLVCDLQAYDAVANKVIATAHFEIPSDDVSLKQAWSLAQAESPWLTESRWAAEQHP
jgi:hypothetical protein